MKISLAQGLFIVYGAAMPELPEVETVRLGVEPVMLGRSFADIFCARRDLRVAIPENFEDALRGHTVVGTRRRGKYMILMTDGPHAVIWHLGMSGRARLYGPGESYAAEKHDHVVFEMEGGARVVFNDPRRFGMMYLAGTRDWQAEKPFCDMGPEPLGNDFSGPVLARRLAGKRCSIKAALLDQRVVVGVGNIYACEALYRAGISPFAAAGDIRGGQAEDLARSIQDVLREALAAGGSSLKDYRQADGELGYFQHSFSVYDREGRHCGAAECESAEGGCVTRAVQAGRSTFYCASRQRGVG